VKIRKRGENAGGRPSCHWAGVRLCLVGILAVATTATVADLASGAIGTPTASSGVTVTSLASVTGVPISETAETLALARVTLDPGMNLPPLEVPGWEIIWQESGTVSVNIRGETEDDDDVEGMEGLLAPVTPGVVQIATPQPDFFTYTLYPGDRLLVPADTPHSVANAGSAPATYLAAAITPVAPAPAAQPWPPAGIGPDMPLVGITITPMSVGYNITTSLIPGLSDVRLDRIDMAPHTSRSVGSGSTAELWYIEQGTLRVTGPATGIATSHPATTWHGDDSATPEPALVELNARNAMRVERETAWSAEVVGSAPVSAIVLSVVSSTAGADATPLPSHSH
jgi:hypothetical protein